jgi:hypothetical protein
MSTIKLFVRKTGTYAGILLMLIAISLGFYSASAVAQPQERIADWSRATNPTASYATPVLKVHLAQNVRAIGYGYPDSDTIIWTKTGGVPKGDFRVVTKPQPCGSTRTWVGVARLLDDSLQLQKLSQTRDCATSFGAHVNDVCGPDQDKLFVVRASVPKGNKITWGGTHRLALSSGSFLHSGAWHPAGLPNIVEFYYPARPNQHVDTAHPARTSGFVTKSAGAVLRVRVTKICQGYGS